MMAGDVSLMDGWLPTALQAATVAVLVAGAVGGPSARWRPRWLPPLLIAGVLAALAAHWCFEVFGLASEPAPTSLWVWTGVTAAAVGIVAVGWPDAGWFRRNVTVLATSLCLLSVGVTVNTWIGYFPTVGTAWNQLAARPLPAQADWATVAAMRRRSTPPAAGAFLPVRTGSAASGFAHRDEYVWLPPAWFATPTPWLPAVMMIGGQFNTPADWLRAGDAVTALDGFAALHHGFAPVAVFVDSNGSFANDTECVNGRRGNAADHLTKDVIPYVSRHFAVGTGPRNWAVTGFSAGGTCAVGLAVMHPDLFGAFVDIAGDLGPNAGTKDQTVDRLYGGDTGAWSEFDPATAITRHAVYSDLSGRFVVPTATQPTDGYLTAARTLCDLGRSRGIDCDVLIRPGRHVWPFAAAAFAESLSWLAAALGLASGVDDPPRG